MSSMMAVFLLIIISFVLLLLAAFYRAYAETPIAELKRRARNGNRQASALYQVVRHGPVARKLLAGLAVFLFAVQVVYMGTVFNSFTSVLFICGLVVLLRLAYLRYMLFMPVIVPVSLWYALALIKLRPFINKLSAVVRKYIHTHEATSIYEMDDLVELIKKQKTVNNNRIEKTELDMALHVLTFGNKLVKDYMVPRSVVYFVRAEDPIGPILLTELHDTGFSRFPVRKTEDEEVVGTLYLKDLVEKRTTGIVGNVMSPDVYYVKEDDTLERVLAAFLSYKHHLFVVRNSFHEITGIITIEDVLEQVMGRRIVDESDTHEDMRQYAHDQIVGESEI